MDSESEKGPICVFGTGRSGTTIFFKVLGAHPDLGWVSNLVERMPTRPEMSVFSRLHPIALKFGPGSRLSRYIPHPAESLMSLRVCTDALFQEPREITSEDIPPETARKVRDFHARVLRFQGRRRLAVKHTGFPRFRFWRTIFPDARFIHVLRDGRAVALSMMRVPWWDGTMNSWWWGPMSDQYMLEYENSGRRPAVLAAIVWKSLLDIYEEEMNACSECPVTVVRFDAFTAEPTLEMHKVAVSCGLPHSRTFQKAIRKFPIRNADSTWHKEMDRGDLEHVERVLEDHLSRYGFL